MTGDRRGGGKTNPVPPPKRGRPRISEDGRKLVVAPFWIPADMLEAIRQAAHNDGGRSMSSLARAIFAGAKELEDYLP